MKKAIILLLLSASIQCCVAQQLLYPDYFLVYTNTPYLNDPSYIPETGKFNLNFSYKARRVSSDISTIVFSAEKIFRNDKGSNHLIRAIAFNEKEGPYISYPRGYLNYARSILLGKNISLYSGLSLGIAGVNFTLPSGGGSARFADGSIGVGIRIKSLRIGISSLQIFNSHGQAISQSLQLMRHFALSAEGAIKLNESYLLKYNTLIKFLPTIPDHYHAGLGISYQKIVETGLHYNHFRGITGFIAIQFFPNINPLYLNFGYTSAIFNKAGNYQEAYEISIRYSIN